MNLAATCEMMVREAALLESQGRLSEALAAYQRLLGSWPGLPNCWYNLARLQRTTGDFSAALISYQEALERGVSQPEMVHLNRGVIYSDCLGQFDAARRELDRALELNPDCIPALVNMANLLEDLGRRDLAAAMYERLLILAPDEPQVLARYAGLKLVSDTHDPIVARLRSVLSVPTTKAADRASVEFALGRVLDSCQAYDAAFQSYRSANRHSRESVGPDYREYNLSTEEKFIDRVIAAFPPTPGGVKSRPLASNRGPRPIFVCGMFRSGSTLAEQMLAGHPHVTSGGELALLPQLVQTDLEPFPESLAAKVTSARLQSFASEYLNRLRGMFPEALWVTDKRPDNFLYIGLIKLLFPDAKIVHTRRDPLDNCLSIYFLHLDQTISYALDLMDTGHYYLQYLRLMRHWKTLYGADIFDLSYDSLVADPRNVLEKALAFLGLDWDERCMSVPEAGRGIRTASVWQVREPIYRRSSGRARHYERQLQALAHYLNRLTR